MPSALLMVQLGGGGAAEVVAVGHRPTQQKARKSGGWGMRVRAKVGEDSPCMQLRESTDSVLLDLSCQGSIFAVLQGCGNNVERGRITSSISS